MNMKHDNCKRDMGILLISLLVEKGGIDGLDVNLNLFNDKLGRKVFLPHPSSPARRGSTSLLNPPLLRREDLKPGRPGLYSQTSSRP